MSGTERTIRPLQRATDANNAKADVLARYANRWRVGYAPADDVPELILFLRTIDGST
jgi:hypothetical protein